MTQPIPQGYKQTEIGIIPEDWEVANIESVSAIPMQNGLFYEPKRKGKGIPLINVGDMYTSAPLDIDSLELFDATTNELKVFRVVCGDLFFTRSSVVPSGIAYCNIFDSDRNDVVFDSHLIRVRPNTEVIDPKYLYLNCNSKLARTALIAESKTATMTTIDQGAINRCPVLIPPKPEQTAIATALSDVDALISGLESLIAKKQAIKTATMQQLLTGKTRLPPFAHHPDGTAKSYQQTELGLIPEDWGVVKLGDIGQTIIGLTYSPRDVVDYGTLVLRSSNVQNGKLAYEDNVYVNMELPERVVVKEGDILVCVRNGSRQLIGKCALIDRNAAGSAFGAFMSVFRTPSSKFIFYQFQSNLIQNQINEIMGATINQITNKDMSNFIVTLPKLKQEQTAIAQTLSDMDEEIQALEARLSKTKQIKQGMMQVLLTGKRRLIKLSKEVIHE